MVRRKVELNTFNFTAKGGRGDGHGLALTVQGMSRQDAGC